MSPRIAVVYDSALRTTDYDSLGAHQRAFAQAARSAEVRVQTRAGTDLWFRIGDRPVTRQDGDASTARARAARNLIDREVELPAGAIRVAQIEETVNGRIVFPTSTWAGEKVEGLSMTIRRGQVIDWQATTGRDAVERELAQAGPPARWFREFALGFNPLLAIPQAGERWIPYYGYGAGVVRLSLGDNTELGGRIGGGYVRWNFFTDATVFVGSEVWVRDGRLVK
jgi:leucyl aminopeptidase (aminopeptidase T)